MNLNFDKHKKIVIVLFYAIVTLTASYFLFVKVVPIVSPFIAALIISMVISPIVDFFVKKIKLDRRLSSILVIILIFILLFTIIGFTINQIYELSEKLINKYLLNGNIQGLAIISDKIQEFTGRDIDLVSSFQNFLTPIAQGILTFTKTVVSNVPDAFVASIVFILSTYFMVSDKERILKAIYKVIGKRNEIWIKRIKEIAKSSIVKYIKAQFIMILITLSELLLGFFIIRILGIDEMNYFFLIALGIAVLDALPIFGTGGVLVPWCMWEIVVARFDFAFALLIIYITCLVVRQMIEPKIVGESLGIHPLITLLSMYVGLKTIGVGGMIILPVITLFVIQLYKFGAFDIIKKIINNE